MIRIFLGIYWKWRLSKNYKQLEILKKLRSDCSPYPHLMEEVEELIFECKKLVLIAERESLKYRGSVI